MGQGIKLKYYIDKEYFVYGEAYRLRLGTNKYVKMLCIDVKDDEITLMYHNKEIDEVIKLTLNTNDLMYNNSYDIVKLIEDYGDGVFGE